MNIRLPLIVSLALLFAVIGNYLGKTRSNFFAGVRTPRGRRRRGHVLCLLGARPGAFGRPQRHLAQRRQTGFAPRPSWR